MQNFHHPRESPRDHDSTTSLSQPPDPVLTSSSDTKSNVVDVDVADQNRREDLRTTMNVVDGDVADQNRRGDLKNMMAGRSLAAFSVSLTREKIEADLLAMGVVGGGSKRRAKSVQKKPDHLFPMTGLRFKKITPDDYRVIRRIRD